MPAEGQENSSFSLNPFYGHHLGRRKVGRPGSRSQPHCPCSGNASSDFLLPSVVCLGRGHKEGMDTEHGPAWTWTLAGLRGRELGEHTRRCRPNEFGSAFSAAFDGNCTASRIVIVMPKGLTEKICGPPYSIMHATATAPNPLACPLSWALW